MSKTQSPDPAQADLDAWRCDRCNGDGWHYVEREGVDPRDIVRTKEHCEECDGIGWCGPDARIAAGLLPHSVAEVVFFDPASRGPLPEKSGLIIDASLAFFRSAKIGDKLYSQAQMRAALSRCAIPAPEGAQTDRERFETYFAESRRSRGPSKRPTFEQFEDGTYKDDHTQRHWWTWQQARAALAAPAPQALPATLTDEMRAVLANEKCVYRSADELYAALLATAPQTKEPTNDR